MGTRADFYIIREDKKMDWVGSLFKDGQPWNIPTDILIQINPVMFEELTVEFLQTKDSVLKGAKWPWPWPDSLMTDYSYIFGLHQWERPVAYSASKKRLFDPLKIVQGKDLISAYILGTPVFPTMSYRVRNSAEEIAKYGLQPTEVI
jgi:hypothetical protein